VKLVITPHLMRVFQGAVFFFSLLGPSFTNPLEKLCLVLESVLFSRLYICLHPHTKKVRAAPPSSRLPDWCISYSVHYFPPSNPRVLDFSRGQILFFFDLKYVFFWATVWLEAPKIPPPKDVAATSRSHSPVFFPNHKSKFPSVETSFRKRVDVSPTMTLPFSLGPMGVLFFEMRLVDRPAHPPWGCTSNTFSGPGRQSFFFFPFPVARFFFSGILLLTFFLLPISAVFPFCRPVILSCVLGRLFFPREVLKPGFLSGTWKETFVSSPPPIAGPFSLAKPF